MLALFVAGSVRYRTGMTEPLTYVETTIPSFYHEAGTAPDIVVRREWTRRWWDGARERYELVTSAAVLDELAGGIPEHSAIRMALVRDLSLLPIEPAIAEIGQAYVQHKVMSAEHDPNGLVAYYMELQKRYQDRLMPTEKATKHKSAA